MNLSASLFNLIVEIYKTYSNLVETKLLNYIDTFKELSNYQIDNLIKKYNKKYFDFDFDRKIKNSALPL